MSIFYYLLNSNPIQIRGKKYSFGFRMLMQYRFYFKQRKFIEIEGSQVQKQPLKSFWFTYRFALSNVYCYFGLDFIFTVLATLFFLLANFKYSEQFAMFKIQDLTPSEQLKEINQGWIDFMPYFSISFFYSMTLIFQIILWIRFWYSVKVPWDPWIIMEGIIGAFNFICLSFLLIAYAWPEYLTPENYVIKQVFDSIFMAVFLFSWTKIIALLIIIEQLGLFIVTFLILTIISIGYLAGYCIFVIIVAAIHHTIFRETFPQYFSTLFQSFQTIYEFQEIKNILLLNPFTNFTTAYILFYVINLICTILFYIFFFMFVYIKMKDTEKYIEALLMWIRFSYYEKYNIIQKRDCHKTGFSTFIIYPSPFNLISVILLVFSFNTCWMEFRNISRFLWALGFFICILVYALVFSLEICLAPIVYL
jgi:hypothetical protein